MGMIPYATVASYVRQTVLNPALNYQLNLMEPMIKMIRFTSETFDDDECLPIFSHLELPYIEGVDLDELVGKVNYEDYMSFSKAFIPLYPDKVSEIESFDNCGSISYEMFGYEERDDVLTLTHKPDELPVTFHSTGNAVYISAKRVGIEYDYRWRLFKHVIEVTYREFKLNKGFTWGYVGEPFTVIEHLQDFDFKQTYG